jgi:hypothetical protein
MAGVSSQAHEDTMSTKKTKSTSKRAPENTIPDAPASGAGDHGQVSFLKPDHLKKSGDRFRFTGEIQVREGAFGAQMNLPGTLKSDGERYIFTVKLTSGNARILRERYGKKIPAGSVVDLKVKTFDSEDGERRFVAIVDE